MFPQKSKSLHVHLYLQHFGDAFIQRDLQKGFEVSVEKPKKCPHANTNSLWSVKEYHITAKPLQLHQSHQSCM